MCVCLGVHVFTPACVCVLLLRHWSRPKCFVVPSSTRQLIHCMQVKGSCLQLTIGGTVNAFVQGRVIAVALLLCLQRVTLKWHIYICIWFKGLIVVFLKILRKYFCFANILLRAEHFWHSAIYSGNNVNFLWTTEPPIPECPQPAEHAKGHWSQYPAICKFKANLLLFQKIILLSLFFVWFAGSPCLVLPTRISMRLLVKVFAAVRNQKRMCVPS